MIRGIDLITGISVTLVRLVDEVIPCHFPLSFKPDIGVEVYQDFVWDKFSKNITSPLLTL